MALKSVRYGCGCVTCKGGWSELAFHKQFCTSIFAWIGPSKEYSCLESV